jgi:predicted hydrocarbon binding protein
MESIVENPEHTPGDFACPNAFGRVYLYSMEEILGRSGLNAVLNRAGLNDLIEHYPLENLDKEVPYRVFSQISAALEGVYGVRGGRGLSLRAGRVAFNRNLRAFGEQLGVDDQAFRLLPVPQKISQGLQALAALYNQLTDQQVGLEEDESSFYWVVRPCPLCWGRQSPDPVCHYLVGMLQEALYWLSGGKFYLVTEIDCIAKSDPVDRIQIDKRALD